MCRNISSKVTIIVDQQKPSGVLAHSLPQSELENLLNKLEKIKEDFDFEIKIPELQSSEIFSLSRKHFGRNFKETHCFRGYPTFTSIKQFHDTNTDYILHLDCDMIFHETPPFSWIDEGIKLMEENTDILCVLPRGGPPTLAGQLHQGDTEYIRDDNRKVFLFKNFTSRHYLIHRQRFLSLLPIKPLWLSWREPIKSRFFGNGKMLCWENMVEYALTKSDMWRADLMTDQAWSLHPGDRSEEFYKLLPQIIDSVSRNEYPEEQRGHFDLRLCDWKLFLN
jgi:hypothetical protein